MGVDIRSAEELELMRQSGRITALALKKAIESAKAGMNLKELDQIIEDEILKNGGGSSFKTVKGYFWSSCLTVNDEVVHGIPREEVILQVGDVLGVDLGAVYKGWHTDAAWSVVVGLPAGQAGGSGEDEEKKRFLEVGEKTLWKAVEQARDGNRVGDISSVIQISVEGAGYNVVRALVGHGVGRAPHEEPEIPGFGKAGTGVVLSAGMTIAIEVIYTMGGYEVYHKEDAWTVATEDGSLGGLFEMSVIVGKEKGEVITDWRKV